jgi:CheY-like chemotaxis protein
MLSESSSDSSSRASSGALENSSSQAATTNGAVAPGSSLDAWSGAATLAPSAAATNVPVAGNSHRVLVIEGDVETADLIVSVLENAGYEVEVATDGSYGLILLDSFNPELILMGSTLQRISGTEVVQSIRSAPQYSSRFRSTPIIYIGDNKQLIQQRFHTLPDTPMSDYIFKPIDVTELLDKVGRIFVGHDGI